MYVILADDLEFNRLGTATMGMIRDNGFPRLSLLNLGTGCCYCVGNNNIGSRGVMMLTKSYMPYLSIINLSIYFVILNR